jgi:hypothetical protein
MDIIVQLISPGFWWLWAEIGKNAFLSFMLAFPLALASKKKWPVAVSMFIGVFAIDLHGYSKVLSNLGFEILPLTGRTIVNSYGFELLLINSIYLFYLFKIFTFQNNKTSWAIKERFSLLILSVAIGFQANIFIDTLINNDDLFYEPLITLLKNFVDVKIDDVSKLLLGLYIVLFLTGIYLFSWEFQKQKEACLE